MRTFLAFCLLVLAGMQSARPAGLAGSRNSLRCTVPERHTSEGVDGACKHVTRRVFFPVAPGRGSMVGPGTPRPTPVDAVPTPSTSLPDPYPTGEMYEWCTVREATDRGGDGPADDVETTYRGQEGRILRTETDYGATGSPESILTRLYLIGGQLAHEVRRTRSDRWQPWRRSYSWSYGRVLGVENDVGADGSPDRVYHYSYDADGHMVSLRTDSWDAGQVVRSKREVYVHDDSGRRIRTEGDNESDGRLDYTYWYSWVEDLIVRIEVDGTGDGTSDTIIEYAYDDLGRVSEVSVDRGRDGAIEELTRLFYTDDGQLARSETYHRSVLEDTTTVQYDADGRVARIIHTGPAGGTEWSYSYSCQSSPTCGVAHTPGNPWEAASP